MKLLPFQEKAVSQMLDFLKTTKGCYNACEQGLGKTIQSITTVNKLECESILIICPAIMRLVWRDEISKWHANWRGLPYSISVQISSKKAVVYNQNPLATKGCAYIITSYGLATKGAEFLGKEFPPDMLILDEAHFLKSSSSARTKQILKHIWPKAKYKIALSGTPFTNSVIDGYTLFHRLNQKAFPDFYSFANRYAYRQHTPWGIKYFGVRNAEELSKTIRNSFYVRYTKEEVLQELPDKQFQKITLPKEYAVPVNKDDRAKAQEELKQLLQALNENKAIPSVPKTLQGIRRLQGILKVKPITEFVQNLLDQDIPVVLFAYHKDVIKKFTENFSKHNPATITGETNASERHKGIERFRAGETNLFIGQMVAAGTGITLTRSSTCILAELDWSPSTVSQAIDRLHRIGQKETVNVHYFVVEDSIDANLVNVLMDKVKTFAKVIENEH